MSTLDDIQDLAAALHTRRDDWDLVPTLNYLLPHRSTPIEHLWPAAVAWAENPKNRTPASLQYLKIQPRQSPESSSTSRKNRTDICVCGERHERRPMVLDEPPVASPERAAAKARAREAIDQARRKAAWTPSPPPSERRIQAEEPEPAQQEST